MKKSSQNAEPTIAAVGVDLGDRWSYWCALDGQGEVAGRGRVATTPEAMAEQAGMWAGVRVALENGTHSGWVSRALDAAGCEVVVANPSRWRGTAHDSKRTIATMPSASRVVRVDPAAVVSDHAPADGAAERSGGDPGAAQLVKVRTQLVNTARSVVKSLGARLSAADAAYFAKTWEAVPEALAFGSGPAVSDAGGSQTRRSRHWTKRRPHWRKSDIRRRSGCAACRAWARSRRCAMC